MSVEYLTVAFKERKTKHATRLVLLALANISDHDGRSWPSVEYLVAASNTTRKTVQRSLRDLEEIGYLETSPRERNNGSSSTNLYRLIFSEICPEGGRQVVQPNEEGGVRITPPGRQIVQDSGQDDAPIHVIDTIEDTEKETPKEKANEPSSSATPPKKKNPKQVEITWRIEKTWEAHTKERENFFLHDTERRPPPSALTEARRKLIADALHRWDSDFLGADQRDEWLEKSWVRAAAVGIFFDEFMTMKRHLNPERCWKIHNGIDQVERFGLLYFEVAGAEEDSHDPAEDYPWAETEDGGVKCLACSTRMSRPAAHACHTLAALRADGSHPQQAEEA